MGSSLWWTLAREDHFDRSKQLNEALHILQAESFSLLRWVGEEKGPRVSWHLSLCLRGTPGPKRHFSTQLTQMAHAGLSPRRTRQLPLRAATGAAPSQLGPGALGPHGQLSRPWPTRKGPVPLQGPPRQPVHTPRRSCLPQTSALHKGPGCRGSPQFSAAPALPRRALSPSPPSQSSSGPLSWEGRSERREAAGRKATPPPPETVLTGPWGVEGTRWPYLLYVHGSALLAGEMGSPPQEETARPRGQVRRLQDPSPKRRSLPSSQTKWRRPWRRSPRVGRNHSRFPPPHKA